MTSKPATARERLPFELDPQIIHHIIYSQAGSIGKALIELIMNSVDARASHVRLTISREGFECQDDGAGFASRLDVERYFGRFGTPHEEGDATYGRFRLGRGQIMAHASTVWTSNRWRMFVDTRVTGYHYDLEELDAEQVGCGITGTWYEPLSQAEWMSAVQEVRDLVKYTPVTVELNGRVITRDPRSEKWDFEDENAYYRVKEDGAMSIYNLGVLVRHDSSHLWGAGGLVVTKKAIALNVSRTEILRKTCTTWKPIAAKLTSLANALTKRLGDHRKTEARRARNAQALLSGEEGMATRFYKEEVVTILPGKKHITLWDFVQECRRYEHGGAFAVVENGMDVPKAEGMARDRVVTLVHPKTLERFGCYNGTDFADCLERIWEQIRLQTPESKEMDWLARVLAERDVPRLVSFQKLKEAFQERTQVVSEKHVLDKEGRRIWTSLKCVLVHYAALLTGGRKRRDGSIYGGRRYAFMIGESNVADAWTDGKSYIAVNQNVVQRLNATPVKTAGRIFSLVEHELAHEGDSLDCGHDEAFYQRFHELVVNFSEERQRFMHMFMGKYVRSLDMEGKHPKRNEVWTRYNLVDQAGNGREKRGLSRALEVMSEDSDVSEALAEESMSLLQVINAGLIESGCCPPPVDWERVRSEACQAQAELDTVNRQEREEAAAYEAAEELWDQEWEEEQARVRAEFRRVLAALLSVDDSSISPVALEYYLRSVPFGLPESCHVHVREAWAQQPWIVTDEDRDYPTWDEMYGETITKEEPNVAEEATDPRAMYGEELGALIEPGETQWSLARNAAAAGFSNVANYLKWRSDQVSAA